jgi:transcriptional regulator with GAF, ATPase, and Fis domain
MILSLGSSLALDGALSDSAVRSRRSAGPASRSNAAPDTGTLAAVEREHIFQVLEECQWKVKGPGHAADRLGLKASTLRYRMKKLAIGRPPRRPR